MKFEAKFRHYKSFITCPRICKCQKSSILAKTEALLYDYFGGEYHPAVHSHHLPAGGGHHQACHAPGAHQFHHYHLWAGGDCHLAVAESFHLDYAGGSHPQDYLVPWAVHHNHPRVVGDCPPVVAVFFRYILRLQETTGTISRSVCY